MPEATHYTEETFAKTYDLSPEEAGRIMGTVETAKADLDIFILTYRDRTAM